MRRAKNALLTPILVACALVPGQAVARPAPEAGVARPPAAVKGRVFAGSLPVAEASVYAYEVASYALQKVLTDREGHFLFRTLPAGMYKIVAHKDGLIPAVELLLRRRPDAYQFVEIQMRDEGLGDVRQAEDYWTARSKIPADVLRLIHRPAEREPTLEPGARVEGLSRLEGTALARGGTVDLGAETGSAQLTAAEIDLEGAVGALEVGVDGRFEQLTPTSGAAGDGAVQSVAVEVRSAHDSKLRLTSASGEIAALHDRGAVPVALRHYQLQWSSRAGDKGRSGFSARYTQEANYYQTGWMNPPALPEASRTWDLEGFYRGELTDSTSLEAGVTYRQRIGEDLPLLDDAQTRDPLIDEAIGLYGLADSQILPRVVIEYGIFSSVREGSWSLMPHGGMVVDLGADWEARTTFARRVDRSEPQLPRERFSTAFHNDAATCRDVGEACYEVFFRRGDDDDAISVGAVHREFAETLRLYFSPDFFDRLESVFFVDGDAVPELQFSMVRRISPKVLAKLESNIAAGGGGIFYATDDVPYENQIRYLVTSLDTRFQKTSTGVFLAFHHLEQALNPVDPEGQAAAPEVEIQRLQLMLTQDLNVLANLASNLAVRLNVEVSRGATPYQLSADEDEIIKKLTGGISLSF